MVGGWASDRRARGGSHETAVGLDAGDGGEDAGRQGDPGRRRGDRPRVGGAEEAEGSQGHRPEEGRLTATGWAGASRRFRPELSRPSAPPGREVHSSGPNLGGTLAITRS